MQIDDKGGKKSKLKQNKALFKVSKYDPIANLLPESH